MQIVFGDWHTSGTIDLEAVELLVRDAMHHAGAMAMQRLLCMRRRTAARFPAPAVSKLDTTNAPETGPDMLGPVAYDGPTICVRAAIKDTVRAIGNWT